MAVLREAERSRLLRRRRTISVSRETPESLHEIQTATGLCRHVGRGVAEKQREIKLRTGKDCVGKYEVQGESVREREADKRK